MNYHKLNECIRFFSLFIFSYFSTYYFSLFIGVSFEESKILGFTMLSINILISNKRIHNLFKH